MVTHKTPARKRSRVPAPGQTLVDDIRGLIAGARAHVATTANATLTLLYWRVGQRVRSEVLGSNRAAYGEEIVVTLSRQLSIDHGTGINSQADRCCRTIA